MSVKDYWVTRLQLDQKRKKWTRTPQVSQKKKLTQPNHASSCLRFSISLISLLSGEILWRHWEEKTKLKNTTTCTCTESEVFAVAGTRSLSLWPQCNTDEGEAEVAAKEVIINKQNIRATYIKMGLRQPPHPTPGAFSLNLFSFWEHPFSLQIWTAFYWASILDNSCDI